MKQKIDWQTFLFIFFVTAVSLTAVPIYLVNYKTEISILIFSLLFGLATNLSITAGYHRCFSHKSYEASPLLKWLYLLIGAAAFQGSALKWSSDHRRHHSQVDTDQDPYSINKGFMFAHVYWLFLKESSDQAVHAPDLSNDKAIAFQHKHYNLIALFMGFLVPTLVGYFFGSALEGFLIGGILRTFLTQNSTFLVNSLAHTWGARPYSLEITARDNFCVALLTHGEGYHNFHHKFQFDYRNGIRWYHWDPTKWFINTLAFLGQARRLREVPWFEIQKAKLLIDQQRIGQLGVSTERLDALKNKIESLYVELKKLQSEYQNLKGIKDMQKELKLKIKLRRSELNEQFRRWRFEIRILSKQALLTH